MQLFAVSLPSILRLVGHTTLNPTAKADLLWRLLRLVIGSLQKGHEVRREGRKRGERGRGREGERGERGERERERGEGEGIRISIYPSLDDARLHCCGAAIG